MRTIFNKTSFGLLLGALWVAGAAVWAQPRISVHPLMTEQGRRGERWNALFMREVAKQNIAMTPEVEVEAFLEQHEGNCRNEMKCLQNLGYATRAHYILVGSMLRAENIYTLHARVVMLNGVEVKRVALDVERVSKTSEEANALAVYSLLFSELKLESLPTHPPGVSLEPPEIIIETKIETVPEQVVAVPGRGFQRKAELEEQLSQSTSPMRTTSYVFLGIAGVTAASGTVFATMANSNYRKYKRTYTPKDDQGKRTGDTGRIGEDDDVRASERLKIRVRNQKAVAITSFSVATAAAATGITLFFISPERYVKDSKVQVGLMPMQGGALLSLQGVFP